MGRLVYAHDVYGVTAACLMVRKAVYDEVGGLDESFEVAFNDVDFCVRVREAGYTNLITPFARLYHYESKSRGLDESPEKRARFISEVQRFQTRWAKQLAAGDPCLNPNFDDMKEDFSFKIKPLE
jgi:GT2 family glycosyltransferase